MSRIAVKNDYFEWMCDLVRRGRYDGRISYDRLLRYLHNTDFIYTIRGDVDRAYDGIGLRHRFALQNDTYDYDYIMETLRGSCSLLEMMIALAIRCEESIMSDPRVGDRTGQWFWKMITTMGLGGMTDDMYNEIHIDWTIGRFLARDYEPDGTGGLFRVRDSGYDFRKITIWKQMCYFLDTIM